MIKRGMYLVISVIAVFLLLIIYWNKYDWGNSSIVGSLQKEVYLSSWYYDLDEIDSEKSKFSYGISLINGSEDPKYVRSIQVNYNNELLKIIEHDNVIQVNKEIKANEEYKVNWNIVVNTKGLTELNMKTVKSLLNSITIAMNKSNITYYQY